MCRCLYRCSHGPGPVYLEVRGQPQGSFFRSCSQGLPLGTVVYSLGQAGWPVRQSLAREPRDPPVSTFAIQGFHTTPTSMLSFEHRN